MSLSSKQPKSTITNLPWSISPENGSKSAGEWAVILAGGEGLPRNSLVPASRRGQRPKHFCRTPDSDFVINRTRREVSLAFPRERTMFVVSENHLSYSEEVLDDVSSGNIVVEPQDDGTTFAVLYSLMRLRLINPQAVVTFFPADFDASGANNLMQKLEAAQNAVRRQPSLILLGIEPDSADADREWIEPDLSSPLNESFNVWRVRSFRDRLSRREAGELFKRGGLWNSSVMVGTIPTFFRTIRRAAPEVYAKFRAAKSKFGTPGEASAVRAIYHGNFAESEFSRDVLSKSAEQLAVIPVPAAKVRGAGVKPSAAVSAALVPAAVSYYKSRAASGGL